MARNNERNAAIISAKIKLPVNIHKGTQRISASSSGFCMSEIMAGVVKSGGGYIRTAIVVTWNKGRIRLPMAA